MAFLSDIWDKLMGIVPVERWLRQVGNVLRQLTLSFVLIWVLLLALTLNDWEFSEAARLVLIAALLLLLLLVILIVVILAVGQGERLYSPYERSLRRGRRFGTETRPRRKVEADRLPAQGGDPKLPPPPDSPNDAKKLPR